MNPMQQGRDTRKESRSGVRVRRSVYKFNNHNAREVGRCSGTECKNRPLHKTLLDFCSKDQ
eukprot:97418-Amphidinium_carterae.1